jgi:hypothetical protein
VLAWLPEVSDTDPACSPQNVEQEIFSKVSENSMAYTFAEIVANCLASNPTPTSPQISFNYNRGGGGFQQSLICALNSGVHMTIYQNTWDGTASVSGQLVGPFLLHLTAGAYSWFYEYKDGVWDFFPGLRGESPQSLVAMRTVAIMLGVLNEYLGTTGGDP